MRPLVPIIAVLFATSAWAGGDPEQGPESTSEPGPRSGSPPVQTIEKVGAIAPLYLPFVDDTGARVVLRDYFDGQRPVVLNFVYYECPLLCNLVLEGVVDGMRGVGHHPGTDYRLLTLSVNPREGAKLAAAKKKAYLAALDTSGADWAFLTGEAAHIKAFAEAVGWGYRYDAESSEYVHGAVTLVMSPKGTVVRYLHGSRPGALQLRLALVDAGADASVADALLGHLYPYDIAARKYSVSLPAALSLSAVLALPFVLLFGLLAWRRRRGTVTRTDSDTAGLLVRGVIPNG